MKTLFILACATAGALALAAFNSTASGKADIQFTDITQQAGIHFRHNAGKAGRKFLPETMGSGVAVFDFNDDGKLDLLFVNGRDWNPRGRRSLCALYRNNGNGTFTDVTAGSGLDQQMYGMGIATADYDNDGREDVYITALEGDRLFHNEGNGKFRDVTKQSGILNRDFGTSAAWLITTAMGNQTCSSPTMCSGPKREIFGVRSTAQQNRTALLRLTKVRLRSCITISGMAGLRT